MSKEIIIERTAAVATYTGAGGAVLGGLSANELAAIGGLIIGLVGLVVQTIVNVYFQAQRLKLDREALEKKIGGDGG